MKLLIDSREKIPFRLRTFANREICKLETGDYTLEGLEHYICIERKKSVSEIAGNIVAPRFIRELERMSKIERAYLLMEFGEEEVLKFPKYAHIPRYLKRRIRVRGPFILKKLEEFSETYGVELIFCVDRYSAEKEATRLLKEAYENKSSTIS